MYLSLSTRLLTYARRISTLRVLKMNCHDKYVNDNQITLADVTATTKDACRFEREKAKQLLCSKNGGLLKRKRTTCFITRNKQMLPLPPSTKSIRFVFIYFPRGT